MSFKHWLYLSVLLFVFGLIWGLVSPADTSGPLVEGVTTIEGLSDFIAGLSPAGIFLFIYLKNVTAVVFGFLFSPLLLLVPVLALVLNGGVLGLVSVMVVQEKSLGFLLAGILPHGVFEIPALIIGEAAALAFGAAVIRSLFSSKKRAQLRPTFKENIRYLGLSILLLLPAAFIETFVTPLLVR